MVRNIIIEERIKGDIEVSCGRIESCSILIGSVFEDKRFILDSFSVAKSERIEKEFESSLDQLVYALPGGMTPIGLVANNKVMSLLNIMKKANQRLQKLFPLEHLSDPVLLQRSGNKIDGKIFIDGQLKPGTVKFQSFFSTFNEINIAVAIEHSLAFPRLDKFENMKQWKMAMKNEVKTLVESLSGMRIVVRGSICRGDSNLLEDPGKGKTSVGKQLKPRLIFPLKKKLSSTRANNVPSISGSISVRVHLHPKSTTEQAKRIILEDIAKSLFSRVEVLAEEIEENSGPEMLESSQVRLPYRVTFPLGLVHLSVYLLQHEVESAAVQIAQDLFALTPSEVTCRETCREKQICDVTEMLVESEEGGNASFRNNVIAAAGGLVAVIAGLVIASTADVI